MWTTGDLTRSHESIVLASVLTVTGTTYRALGRCLSRLDSLPVGPTQTQCGGVCAPWWSVLASAMAWTGVLSTKSWEAVDGVRAGWVDVLTSRPVAAAEGPGLLDG